MASITGKVVVVTGANRGIGLELTRQLAAKGNHVIATSRKPEQSKELQKVEGSVTITQLDVSSFESISNWAKEVKTHANHLDLVINNAGVASWGRLDDATPEEMIRCFTVNTMGPFFCTQQLHKQGLLGGSRKTIVANMTSKMGSIDDNGSGGTYAYRASKAALNIINKSLSIDFGGDVECVLLHPGFVSTDMVNGRGLISAQESAQGLIGVLESGLPLNGRWYDYKKEEIAW